MMDQQETRPAQRMREARVVRMDRKVVLWAVFCATVLALVTFSLLFVHAAYRKGWW